MSALDSPLVIGGVGGSGTGTVAEIVAAVGFMGERLNRAHDALDLAAFDWRWGRRYLEAQQAGTEARFAAAMKADLSKAVARHRAPVRAEQRWGWKHPHSLLLLPFLADAFPRMRFVHVIRDGRDMAFSGNRNQLRRYGDLAGVAPGGTPVVRAMTYWVWANTRAADHGEALLGPAYLRLRLEDLCDEPRSTALRLLRFAGAGDAAHELAREATWRIRRPDTLGRWRHAPPEVVEAASRCGAPALARFGYCGDALIGAPPSVVAP